MGNGERKNSYRSIKTNYYAMKNENVFNLDFFKSTDWYKLAQYHECILMKYIGFDWQRRSECKEEIKKGYKYNTFLCFDDAEYLNRKEFSRIEDFLIKKYKKNKNLFVDYIKLTIKNCKNCVDYSKKIKSIKNFDKLSSKEIVNIFDKYVLTILKVMPFVYTLSLFENLIIKILREDFKSKQLTDKQITDYILKLSKPASKSFSVKEKEDLLKLGEKIQSSNNIKNIKQLILKDLPLNIRRRIKAHQERYGWMGILFMMGGPYSLNKFLKNLKEILGIDCKSEIKKLEKENKNKEKEIKNIIKNFSIPGKNVKVLRELAFLRGYRIDMINISNYNALVFLKNIAERLNLTYQEMLCLLPYEITKALKNDKAKKELKQKIKERKKGWGLIFHKDKLELITGKKYNSIKKEIFSKDFSLIKEIKGMPAYKGNVIGKVFVALDSSNLDKITSKHILIAPETTVDFEVAMNRAKAIVTDRGGILSHAAIVSREFKKPCIVGTDIATKVLKDGDLVEVDANKGIVKILAKD